MEQYKRRMIEELFLLDRKRERLAATLNNPNPAIKPKQLELLGDQKIIMDAYSEKLAERLSDDLDSVVGDQFEFSFGTCIELLKEGYAMARKGWNGKNMFIVKQIPCDIEEHIIPSMQSLPDTAKALILNGPKHISYSNQNLIFNLGSGRADSWVPSSSDMYAEDWVIVANPTESNKFLNNLN